MTLAIVPTLPQSDAQAVCTNERHGMEGLPVEFCATCTDPSQARIPRIASVTYTPGQVLHQGMRRWNLVECAWNGESADDVPRHVGKVHLSVPPTEDVMFEIFELISSPRHLAILEVPPSYLQKRPNATTQLQELCSRFDVTFQTGRMNWAH